MVALDRFDSFDLESGPLALLRARRAEADAALPKSAALAALFHLTFAVLVFAAMTLLRLGGPIVLAPPEENEERIVDIGKFGPLPRAGGDAPPPILDKVAVVIPVKDEDFVPPRVEPEIVPDEPGEESGEPGGDPNSRLPGITGGVGGGEGGIPSPDAFIFYEEQPELMHKVAPVYPELAKQAGMEGKVIVRMFIGTDGRIQRAEIERSSPMFDEAALTAVRQWIFRPALTNSRPVAVWVRVPIEFRLHE